MKEEKERKKHDEEEEAAGAAHSDPSEEKLPASGSDDSDDEDSSRRRAGVEGLIEIENPNRVAQKSKKVTQIEIDEPKQLSRREREEIEKQKAKERYMKMHLAGKTDQAKADLARLAIIRKQREEAARKKEAEKKGKDQSVTEKTIITKYSPSGIFVNNGKMMLGLLCWMMNRTQLHHPHVQDFLGDTLELHLLHFTAALSQS